MNPLALDWNPGRNKLRQFGLIAFLAMGALGCWILWKGGVFGISLGSGVWPVVTILWSLGGSAGVLALIYPEANRILYLGLTFLTYPIGYVVSHVIMGVLFYLVITPVGLLFRLLGRDPLKRKWDPTAASYWEPRGKPPSKDRYLRQF